jgi:hypothetical protein
VPQGWTCCCRGTRYGFGSVAVGHVDILVTLHSWSGCLVMRKSHGECAVVVIRRLARLAAWAGGSKSAYQPLWQWVSRVRLGLLMRFRAFLLE